MIRVNNIVTIGQTHNKLVIISLNNLLNKSSTMTWLQKPMLHNQVNKRGYPGGGPKVPRNNKPETPNNQNPNNSSLTELQKKLQDVDPISAMAPYDPKKAEDALEKYREENNRSNQSEASNDTDSNNSSDNATLANMRNRNMQFYKPAAESITDNPGVQV